MDQATLKAVLAAQDEAYKGALDVFMKDINTKLRDNDNVIKELTRSLEFTQAEVLDLKQQVTRLEREKQEDRVTLTTLRKSAEDLEARANYQEDYSRRNNLHITGVDERPGENWEQTTAQVTKLLEEKLNLRDIELERAHRVGQPGGQRNRPIVARFNRYQDRENVRRSAVKLRGTRIYINEDLCKASQEKRRQQLPLMKQARSEGKVAYFNHTRLIVKERTSARHGALGVRSNVPIPAAIVDGGAGGADGGSADAVTGGVSTDAGDGGAGEGVSTCPADAASMATDSDGAAADVASAADGGDSGKLVGAGGGSVPGSSVGEASAMSGAASSDAAPGDPVGTPGSWGPPGGVGAGLFKGAPAAVGGRRASSGAAAGSTRTGVPAAATNVRRSSRTSNWK